MARSSRPSPQSSARPKPRGNSILDEHRSLKALQAEAAIGETLEDVMRRKCRAMVAHAKTFGWSGPPFDPTDLASIFDVRVEFTDEQFGSEGRIFPRNGDVVIECSSTTAPERQRFTICHELAHTCFPDVFEFVRAQDGDPDSDPGHKKFENLCDIGAAELLMPHSEFLSDLHTGQMCLSQMDVLRNRYVASIEATLKRMMDMTPHPCAAVFLTDETFKQFPGRTGQLRVKWMWKSSSFKGYLPSGTLAPGASGVLHSVSDTVQPFSKTRETWWISNKPRSWYVEGVRLPAVPGIAAYPKIAVLLHARLP
jgi:hypothetical protein